MLSQLELRQHEVEDLGDDPSPPSLQKTAAPRRVPQSGIGGGRTRSLQRATLAISQLIYDPTGADGETRTR